MQQRRPALGLEEVKILELTPRQTRELAECSAMTRVYKFNGLTPRSPDYGSTNLSSGETIVKVLPENTNCRWIFSLNIRPVEYFSLEK